MDFKKYMNRTPNPVAYVDEAGINRDENGKEIPKKYLFGIIADYGNPFEESNNPDAPPMVKLAPFLYVIPIAIILNWKMIVEVFF